jgi:hypothetical protein
MQAARGGGDSGWITGSRNLKNKFQINPIWGVRERFAL